MAQTFMGGGSRIGQRVQEVNDEQREVLLAADHLEIVDVSEGWEGRGFDITGHRYWIDHPWASTLWVSRINLGPARMKYMDTALRVFREGGLSEELTHHAYHVVENHIVGYTMQQMSFAVDMDNLDTLADEFLATLPADRYPDLALHVSRHIDEPPEPVETEFEFGLRLILDGIDRMHEH
jgi:hypothetical protein